ncbi:MAG: hypothetical protein WC533_00410 [Candidatus Pacearchaeota archaeon]
MEKNSIIERLKINKSSKTINNMRKRAGLKVNSAYFKLAVFTLSLYLILVLTMQMTSAVEVSYCCEKTLSGAYCQNSPLEQCDAKFQKTPTSCEATSFCKRGCCYDSDEGVCMENVPREACVSSGGEWDEGADCKATPKCELGCCVLGQQAAYVPLVRCKKLSGYYGLITDFRKNVADELSCIALASSQDVGACVFESDYQTTCKFTTRAECNSESVKGTTNTSSIVFHKNYLCTAQELNTICEKTKETVCIEGKDEVYFIDTCGNPANIYDASKINDVAYWAKVVPKDESCGGGSNSANAESKSCGNCNYLEGSICKSAGSRKPTYGSFICSDLNCYDTYNGKDYKNGESWCVYDSGKEDSDAPGSRHFRHICFLSEEIVEPCDDYRKEVCVQDTIGEKEDFAQAGCVANRWEDCIMQNSSRDCRNTDKRDCKWVPILIEKITEEDILAQTIGSINEGLIGSMLKLEQNVEEDNRNWRCVPDVAPGISFWDEGSENQCDLASQSCIVKYEKKLWGKGDGTCVENCECLEPLTAFQVNRLCTNYGDCGSDRNYIGKYVDGGFRVTISKSGEKTGTEDEKKAAEVDTKQQFGGSTGGEFSTNTETTTDTDSESTTKATNEVG